MTDGLDLSEQLRVSGCSRASPAIHRQELCCNTVCNMLGSVLHFFSLVLCLSSISNWFTVAMFCFLSRILCVSVSQFSCSVMFNSLRPHGLQACQVSPSITNSQSLLKIMSIESVMPSNHLIFCCPLLLLPPILPSIRYTSFMCTILYFDFSIHYKEFTTKGFHHLTINPLSPFCPSPLRPFFYGNYYSIFCIYLLLFSLFIFSVFCFCFCSFLLHR